MQCFNIVSYALNVIKILLKANEENTIVSNEIKKKTRKHFLPSLNLLFLISRTIAVFFLLYKRH